MYACMGCSAPTKPKPNGISPRTGTAQKVWAWDAQPGLHTLQVRATDSKGVTQTAARANPVPNGASGWDSTVVTVT